MGESPFPAQYAEAQPQPPPPPPPPPHSLSHTSFPDRSPVGAADGSPAIARSNGEAIDVEEEPYTIKCICGFTDDDGNTVLCEQCNTWQHIECYYPGDPIPEVHKCADCDPRSYYVNGEEAKERQKRLREKLRRSGDERRVKRAGPKGHRKSKPKDVNNVHEQTNGWQHLDTCANMDPSRDSPSHQDQPPPPKRTKTSHKNTASRPSNHRRRSGSNTESVPIKVPPDGHSATFLSPEFIRVHHTNTDFTPAQANVHLDIGVTNLLSAWLDDPEAISLATNGLTQNEVFKHFPQPIEELETSIRKHTHTDTGVEVHGAHPLWPYLTVDQHLLPGDFVGELRGYIGHRDAYRADPSNKWEQLRHPEHFVFFHPCLPIYIDCRSEGTLLRYARRSCRPNLKLETIITGAREYRFCFTAMTEIPQGTEITVGWDTLADKQLQEAFKLGSTAMSDSSRAFVQDWVVTILAHFGGCACSSADDSPCLMEHFDPRLDRVKMPGQPLKPNKRRKSMVKKSPPTANRLANSRAGSEGMNAMDVDDDVDEARSTSRSSRSRTSRDATPSVVESPRDSSAPISNELSERDKKKLMQQERLFDKLAMEEQQGQRRRKRTSGSNANTPVAASSTRNLIRSSTHPNTPAPAARPRLGENGPSYFVSLAAQSSSNPPSRARSPIDHLHGQRRPLKSIQPSTRPIYVDNCTQTVGERPADDTERKNARSIAKVYIPLSQRLLRRSHLRALRATRNCESTDSSRRSSLAKTGGIEEVVATAVTPEVDPSNVAVNELLRSEDIEMADADQNTATTTPLALLEGASGEEEERKEEERTKEEDDKEREEKLSPPATKSSLPASSPPQPPAPPWPISGDENDTESKESHIRDESRPLDLHVDLPPPPFQHIPPLGGTPIMVSPVGSTRASVPLPSSNGDISIVPAPATAPILSPLTNNQVNNGSLVQPSPVKKKMTLSDYVKKRKAETPGIEKPLSYDHTLGSPTSPAADISQGGKSPFALSLATSPIASINGQVIKDERSLSPGEVIKPDVAEGSVS